MYTADLEDNDFIIENYDRIDQSEISKIVYQNIKKSKKNKSFFFRETKRENNSDSYTNDYTTLQRMKDNPTYYKDGKTLSNFINKMINYDLYKKHNLLSRNEVEKIAIKKERVISHPEKQDDFEDFWTALENIEEGEKALMFCQNDLIKSVKEKCEFTHFLAPTWLRVQSRHYHRIPKIDFNPSEIEDNKLKQKIFELVDIIDKVLDLGYLDENNKRLIKSFAGNSQKLQLKTKAFDIFEELKKKSIDISMSKDITDWHLEHAYKTEGNQPRVVLKIQVTGIINIRFGNKEKFTKKQYITYKEVKSNFVKAVIDDVQAHLMRSDAFEAENNIFEQATKLANKDPKLD